MLDLKKEQREQFVKKVTGMAAAALGFKVCNTLLYWTTTCAYYKVTVPHATITSIITV